MVPAIPHIRSGKLRPIGVTPGKRWRVFPAVPSISETVPGFEVVHWYGIWGPKALPQNIVTRWNSEVARIIKTEAMQKGLCLQNWSGMAGRCIVAGCFRRLFWLELEFATHTLRELMRQPEPPEPKRRPIGFVYPAEK